MTGLFLTRFMEKSYNFWDVLNSTLAGLVAITAACATVGPAPALAIGVLAAFTYHFTNKFVLSLGIDDVVGAFSVHGTPGAVGLICTGLFSRQDYIDLAFTPGVIHYSPGRQLGVQLLQVVCTFVWAAGSSSVVLWILTHTLGVRVSEDDEIVGLDFKYHSGYAYETHNKRMLRAKKQIEREQILGQKMRKIVNRAQNAFFKDATSGESVGPGGAQSALASANDLSLHGQKTPTNGTHHHGEMLSTHPSMLGSKDPHAMLAIHEAEDSHSDSDASTNSHHSQHRAGMSPEGASRQRSQLRVSAPVGNGNGNSIPTTMTMTSTDKRRVGPGGSMLTSVGSRTGQRAFLEGGEAPNQSIPDELPNQTVDTRNSREVSKSSRGGGGAIGAATVSSQKGGTVMVGNVAFTGGAIRHIDTSAIRHIRATSSPVMVSNTPPAGDCSLLRHVSFEQQQQQQQQQQLASGAARPSVLEILSSSSSSPQPVNMRLSTETTLHARDSTQHHEREISVSRSQAPIFHTEHSQVSMPPSPTTPSISLSASQLQGGSGSSGVLAPVSASTGASSPQAAPSHFQFRFIGVSPNPANQNNLHQPSPILEESGPPSPTKQPGNLELPPTR